MNIIQCQLMLTLKETDDCQILADNKICLAMYRVFRKNYVFFHNSLQPSLAYIAVRDLQSSQRNASVESLLLAGNFLYNQ